MILKTVTLQEANGLLPLVREHFFRLHMLLAHLQHLRGKLSKKAQKRLVFAKKGEAITLVKMKQRTKKCKTTAKEIKDVERSIEREINGLMRFGAVIKGLVPPHIDFLSVKNQELIFLCWHGGESEITHWHHLDDGSPLRQMIETKSRFGPHVVH